MIWMRTAFLVLASVVVIGPGQVQQPMATEDAPMHIGGAVKPPRILYSAEPDFSEAARGKRAALSAQIYLWVDEKGEPSHVRVVKSAGADFDEAWIAAVKKYKFAPATLDGKPVMVDIYINVDVTPF
jgi:periplasmic protein TonB